MAAARATLFTPSAPGPAMAAGDSATPDGAPRHPGTTPGSDACGVTDRTDPGAPLFPEALDLEGQGTPRTLRCRVLQSPLAGVSDRIFRGLVRRWAPDALLFTEMVNATSLELGHGRIKVEELAGESGPIGVQLFDHRPEAMAEAARRAEAAGAFLIDINMGCPVRKIARKGGGSGLIRDPDLAARIVEAIASAVSIPVTVKTRLGWCGGVCAASDAPDTGRPAEEPGDSAEPAGDPQLQASAVAWCRRLEAAGARLLTLHGRSREQGFKGRSDWRAIAAVKRALAIPVIANGDVNSPAEALRCLQVTGADGVMVGRGTMGHPWLVGQIDAALSGRPVPQTPTAGERLQLAAEQLQALVAARGDHGLLIARKHMSWTCNGFAGAPQLRQALMRAPTPAEALELLQRAQQSLESGADSERRRQHPRGGMA